MPRLFQVSRKSQGEYQITFHSPFAAPPIVVAVANSYGKCYTHEGEASLQSVPNPTPNPTPTPTPTPNPTPTPTPNPNPYQDWTDLMYTSMYGCEKAPSWPVTEQC